MSQLKEVQRVLVAEPDRHIAETLKEFLLHAGYVAHTSYERDSIAQTASDLGCGVVVLDHLFNASKENEVLDMLRQTDPTICPILLVSYPVVEFVVAAYRKGAFDVLIKPVDLFELDDVIKRAFERHNLNRVYQFVAKNLDMISGLMDDPDAAVELAILDTVS